MDNISKGEKVAQLILALMDGGCSREAARAIALMAYHSNEEDSITRLAVGMDGYDAIDEFFGR